MDVIDHVLRLEQILDATGDSIPALNIMAPVGTTTNLLSVLLADGTVVATIDAVNGLRVSGAAGVSQYTTGSQNAFWDSSSVSGGHVWTNGLYGTQMMVLTGSGSLVLNKAGAFVTSPNFSAAQGGGFGWGLSQQFMLWGGNGAPSNTMGQNGDFYFRQDGATGSAIYQKRSGSWVALL